MFVRFTKPNRQRFAINAAKVIAVIESDRSDCGETFLIVEEGQGGKAWAVADSLEGASAKLNGPANRPASRRRS